MSFVVASYNVLATAYIQRAWYPNTPALLLNPAWRIPALVQHIVKLDADILCLQEVEPEMLAALRASLGDRYGVQYARKRNHRPDGCAILFRQSHFQLVDAQTVVFADGGGMAADSGYVALVATLRNDERLLQVTSTHLTWDPPRTPRERQTGYRQIKQLLQLYTEAGAPPDGGIVAGDFNVTAESDGVALIESAGWQDAHRGLERAFTCNANQQARKIDFVFCTPSLTAEPHAPVPIGDRTPLPSAEQPSDHVAILSTLDWLG